MTEKTGAPGERPAIKWIVTDLDGTLLNSENQIPAETLACLRECQEKGIRLILASGRSYVRLMPYVGQLGLKEADGCLIEVNGMAVSYLKTGTRQVFKRLTKKDTALLFPFIAQFRAEFQGYEDDTIYYWIPDWQRPLKIQERRAKGYPENHPLVAGAWSWVTENVHNYPHLIEISGINELPEELNKIDCADEPEKIQRMYEALNERFGGSYEFSRTCPRLIEIAPCGVTKGKTLARMMEQEGLSPEEVMAFGDGENDVDMFRAVKYGIAMGNAADYVKEQAYDVTASNNDNGLAAALRKYHVL